MCPLLTLCREYGGTVLRHPEVVFLDVEDFALRLAPILNHKIDETNSNGDSTFGGKDLIEQWQFDARKGLVEWGVLHRRFARFLWTPASEHVDEATFDVLVKLGVLLPIERSEHFVSGQGVSTGEGQGNVGNGCFLVLMRLDHNASPDAASRMKKFAVLNERWAIVFKCRFALGSAPHGLVERLIASCHVIGDIIERTCWRRGGCFVAHNKGKAAAGGDYALTLALNGNRSENPPTSGMLTITAYGARDGKGVWGAMRFAISSLWRLFDEFPRLAWEAWMECPIDGDKLHHLPSARGDEVTPAGLNLISLRTNCEIQALGTYFRFGV